MKSECIWYQSVSKVHESLKLSFWWKTSILPNWTMICERLNNNHVALNIDSIVSNEVQNVFSDYFFWYLNMHRVKLSREQFSCRPTWQTNITGGFKWQCESLDRIKDIKEWYIKEIYIYDIKNLTQAKYFSITILYI